MPLIDPLQLPATARLPGWIGRTFHSENMTFVYYDIAATTIVRAGQAAVISPHLEHAARTATGCCAIVVDYPIREGF